MIDRPASPSTELGDHIVTVTKKLDVEIDMAYWLARYVYVRHRGRDKVRDFVHRRYFHAGADYHDQVHEIFIVILQPVEEGIW